MRFRASSTEQIHEIRSWLDHNIGKGSEIRPWYAVINDQIIYRCDDGYSWVMAYSYHGELMVEITGLDEMSETAIKLLFG